MQLTPEQGSLLVEILAEHHRRVAKMVSTDTLKQIHDLNRAIFEEFEMRPYTVVCRETGAGYPDPLIYTIHVAGKLTREKVLAEVSKCRADDLDGDGVSPEQLKEWLSQLEVCFAFEGDLSPVADWR